MILVEFNPDLLISIAENRTQEENVAAVLKDILGHGNENCLLPGEPEAKTIEMNRKHGGILITEAELKSFQEIAVQNKIGFDTHLPSVTL